MKKIQTNQVFKEVQRILKEAKSNAYRAVNSTMVKAYWEIGRVIVEEEQKGEKRAEYGTKLIDGLSKKLTEEYGKGFSPRYLRSFRDFFLTYQKWKPEVSKLSWTHHFILLRLDNINIQKFYFKECIENNWSKRELERQINSHLYERLILNKDKKAIKKENKNVAKIENMIKDPFVLEFLGINKDEKYFEKDIEKTLVGRLQNFMLELGKGFAFVGRQKRISLNGDYFYVDLAFYNYILKCFVLFEIKKGKLSHRDIGQMDFYVRYYDKEMRVKGDNPTVGIILCSEKNEMMVKYTLLEDKKNIFASKYKLYLPTEKELRNLIE